MVLHVAWLVLAAASAVVAQTNEANCTDSSFNWMFNSEGQSPCRVAELLADQCVPQGFNIPPLPASEVYFGPTSAQANNCQCGSVFYSLLSACAACQDRNWVQWTTFTQNCSQVFLTVYPEPIPADTSVPHWAFLNVTVNGTFVVTAASSAGGPESVAPAAATSAGAASTSTSSKSSHNTNAGAIAGGVVGGVVGAALLAALIFFLYTKRNGSQRIAQTSAQTGGREILSSPPPSTWSPSLGQSVYQPAAPKPYDPDDPTTFPPARDQYTPMSQMLTGTTYNAEPNRVQFGQYTGVPEV